VVEIRLLARWKFRVGERFLLYLRVHSYGSTVLIPQMLQRLYGYSATNAGLVLGPGAFVIVMLAPLVVRILPKVGVKRLLAFGYFVFALAMWYFASFTLATDYRHEAWARALQGLGIATLFVPVSQLAYSNLPKKQEQQSLQPHESLPESGRQFWDRLRDDAASAPHPISSDRTCGPTRLRSMSATGNC